MSVSTKSDGGQRVLEQQRMQEERARQQERLRAEAKRKLAAEAASGRGAGKPGEGRASGIRSKSGDQDDRGGSVVSRLLDDAKRAASRGFDIVADHMKAGIGTLSGTAKSGLDILADATAAGAELVGDVAKKGVEAASGALVDGAKSMLGGVDEAISGAAEAMNVRAGVDKLNSAGDSLYLRATPESKLEGRWRIVDVGLKGQLGADIRITRDSDNADSGYTVRYDKQSLGAVMGGIGLPKALSLDLKAKLEAGAQTFDAVEMKFDTKEDAIRAGEILQRLQVADTIDDGISAAMGMNPMMTPLRAVGDLVSSGTGQDLSLSGGGNPLGNPLQDDGAPGGVAKLIAGVSAQDLAFLGDKVSAYESTLGTRSRISVEAAAKLGPLNGALEGRLDGTQRVTRRVELPTDDSDGRVTYSVSGGLRLSAKEKLQRKDSFSVADLFPNTPKGSFQLGVDNRLELASSGLTASVSYTIPKGTDLTASGTRVLPEFDALTGKADLPFEKIQLRATTEWREQGFEDPSRGDSSRMTETLTLTDPARAVDAAKDLFAGDWQGAARQVGAKLDIEQIEIARSGVDVQPGIKIGVEGLLSAEQSVILQAGVDDITARRAKTWDPNAPAKVDPAPPQDPALPPAPEFPPAPQDDGATLVTVPTEGLYVRTGPDGAVQGLLQNGTFLRDQGGRQTGADGRQWIEITGTDLNDRPVSGWVAADYVAGHDAARGAMDETGRINPSLEYGRYAAVTVQADDNLWDLARQYGVDPQEMIALNRDHLINSSLIYAGDTVYLPGTAKGPEPLPPPAPAPVEAEPQPAEAPAASGSSVSGGDTGSGSGSSGSSSGSGVAGASPADPAPVAPPVARQTVARRDLDRILRDYQVASEGTVVWRPKAALPGAEAIASGLGGVVDFLGGGGAGEGFADKVSRAANMTIPATEAAALDRLGPIDQARWLVMSDEVSDRALAEYQGRRPEGMSSLDWQNDGQVDAFRHGLWNARMTREFGAEWTEGYATAHEKVAGNPAAREAMDLYNNEVGRRIATENPDASDDDLARLVRAAVDGGELLVIDANGDLQRSDAVAVGAHGEARPGEAAANPGLEAGLRDSRS